jgi:hypothetical protein
MNVIGILNYNMPEITNNLVNQIKKLVKIDYKLIVLDNGSEKNKISKYTTDRKEINTRLTGGMNNILEISKKHNPDYVWLCTNDIKLEYEIDIFDDMINKMKKDKNLGILHPSLIEPVKNYAYQWMIKKCNEKGYTKNHYTYDIIAPIFSKEALNIIDWKFDNKFIYGWGLDYESAYQIRKNGLSIGIDFDVLLSHQTSITYDSGNDIEFKNRQEYYKKAGENMNKVLIEKYGENWNELFMKKI